MHVGGVLHQAALCYSPHSSEHNADGPYNFQVLPRSRLRRPEVATLLPSSSPSQYLLVGKWRNGMRSIKALDLRRNPLITNHCAVQTKIVFPPMTEVNALSYLTLPVRDSITNSGASKREVICFPPRAFPSCIRSSTLVLLELFSPSELIEPSLIR